MTIIDHCDVLEKPHTTTQNRIVFILFSKAIAGKVIMFKTLKPTTNISKMFAMRNR